MHALRNPQALVYLLRLASPPTISHYLLFSPRIYIHFVYITPQAWLNDNCCDRKSGPASILHLLGTWPQQSFQLLWFYFIWSPVPLFCFHSLKILPCILANCRILFPLHIYISGAGTLVSLWWSPIPWCHLDFGCVTLVPGIAQTVDWSSFAWNVSSSWNRTTIFSSTPGGGISSQQAKASRISSLVWGWLEVVWAHLNLRFMKSMLASLRISFGFGMSLPLSRVKNSVIGWTWFVYSKQRLLTQHIYGNLC